MRSNQPVDDLGRSRQRLVEVLGLFTAAYRPAAGRRHSCIEDLVLSHGRWFTPSPLPTDRRQGPQQRCFANASAHAVIYGLTYVEGYATAASSAPFPHAWCARPDGTVEDPTWGDDGRAYLGIPFTNDFLRRQDALGELGPVLFDQHITGWQFLHDGIPGGAVAEVGLPMADA